MNQEARDYRVYYVLCPDDSPQLHFILLDGAGATEPSSPRPTECLFCGPHYEVNVTQPWKIGYVSSEDLDKGWTYTEPPPTTFAGSRA